LIQEALDRNDLEEAKDSAARVVKGTITMEGLINDLLELSRVGHREAKSEVVEVRKLIEQVQETLEAEFASTGAVLTLATPLPCLLGDSKRLHQIFQNLIGNALKYGCQSPGDPVNVGFQDSPTHYKFYVQDAGPGIPEKHQKKIFLLFQRLRKKEEGTGLGLAIVMKSARMLGGNAWVESEPGKGATFWFSIAKRRMDGLHTDDITMENTRG
jgi:signal transduction histidine kinase